MRVVIIGAGVAGAAAARVLHRRGAEVVLLESGDGIGGRVRTVEHDKFAIDSGAIFVMGSYTTTLRYLRESGHLAEMTRWPARVAVLDERGDRHPVRFDRPWTFLGMPRLRWADRLRMCSVLGGLAVRALRHGAPGPFDVDDLAELDDGTTLAQWARANLGERVYQYVVRPLMDPLTGADAETISPSFTVALMSSLTRTRLTVPAGGLGRIAGWLAEDLDVRTGTPALDLREADGGVTVGTPGGPVHADAAVLATDVRTARGLLDGVAAAPVLDALDGVVPISASHVLFGYLADPWPDTTHDLVVRAGAGPHHDYGVLLNSRRHPGSVPEGGQTVSVYLDHHQVPADDETAIVARAREAVEQALGPAEPDFHRVFSAAVSLVAPVPGHYRAMRAARDAMPARIRLAGDFLTHSGIEGALISGERAAHDLLGGGLR
jgi:protoporphyrinogen/coproporphyrinogen III oxidase